MHEANGRPTPSVTEALTSRRATRSYHSEALPAAEVEEFLTLVNSAPTAFNLQDRTVVVVEDPEVRARLRDAALGQKQVEEAPMVLVILAEPQGWKETLPALKDANIAAGVWNEELANAKVQGISSFQESRAAAGLAREFALRNAMTTASFAMVAAAGMGWASSPMTGFDENKVKEVIGAEGSDAVVALLLAVGPGNETPANPGRFPLATRFRRNSYATPFTS